MAVGATERERAGKEGVWGLWGHVHTKRPP